MFPESVTWALEVIGKAIEDTENLLNKSPLERTLNMASEEMVEQKLKSMGWEEKEIEWMRGTAIKDWRIVRLGTQGNRDLRSTFAVWNDNVRTGFR
jgi:hypothetical protein